MKVLMYGWEFPPKITGGLGVACYGIVKSLIAQQIKIWLVLPHVMHTEHHEGSDGFITDNQEMFEIITNVKNNDHDIKIKFVDTILMPYMTAESYSFTKNAVLTDASSQNKEQYGNNLISEIKRYARSAGKIAAQTTHDIIHAHDWLAILAGIEAKKISKKPLVFHVHALETDRSGENLNQEIFDIEKYGFSMSDRIIAVSQYTKNKIVEHYHIDPEKIDVAYNGLFHNPLKYNPVEPINKQKTVLFLGRITHQKGPFYFIDVARHILSKRKDVQFVIAGTGDLLQDLIEYVAQHKLGRYVHFTGFLGRNLVDKIYLKSNVYVMPSISEPFGISCLEALSNNVPVIISKQSGVAEVLPHAIKVDFWDIHGFSDKILSLLDNPELGETLLHKSKADLDGLLWENSAKSIIQSYLKIIEI